MSDKKPFFTAEDFEHPQLPWTSFLKPSRAAEIANAKLAPELAKRDAEAAYLRNKIARLYDGTELGEQRAEIAELKSVGLHSAHERIKDLNKLIGEQKAEIERLRAEVAELSTRWDQTRKMLAGCREDLAWMKGDRDRLRAENERLREANTCDACGGSGAPISSLRCACDGSGKASVAARCYRERMDELQADNARLREALEAALGVIIPTQWTVIRKCEAALKGEK